MGSAHVVSAALKSAEKTPSSNDNDTAGPS